MRLPTRRQLLLAACMLPGLAWAQAGPGPLLLEGQPFERRIRLAGSELQLNGTGLRAVAWLKGYAAGLYLREPATTAAQAVAMAGPKRLQLRMLQEVPSGEFVKAFRKGMSRNAAPGEAERLAERMGRFATLVEQVGTVRKGDVVDLDFDPARGTVFTYNGRSRGEAIPGDDFYAVLLLSFIGERPYDKRLKAGLLGGG